MTRVEEIAWAAGLIEGEGCLYFHRGRPHLQVGSTDRDVLERLQSVFACGSIREHRPPIEGRKQGYLWQIAAQRSLEPILRLLFPLMCERRAAKFREALEVYGG